MRLGSIRRYPEDHPRMWAPEVMCDSHKDGGRRSSDPCARRTEVLVAPQKPCPTLRSLGKCRRKWTKHRGTAVGNEDICVGRCVALMSLGLSGGGGLLRRRLHEVAVYARDEAYRYNQRLSGMTLHRPRLASRRLIIKGTASLRRGPATDGTRGFGADRSTEAHT